MHLNVIATVLILIAFTICKSKRAYYNGNGFDDTIPSHGQFYDFIVVGSGSAGSIIASRLSENPDWKILLLEAGKVENAIAKAPLASYVNLLTPYNWNYVTEHQSNFARGMVGNKLMYPRGKALGGSSVINGLMYSRGNPADYDQWENHGNPGWSYKEVLPYFSKVDGFNMTHYKGKVNIDNPHVSDLMKIFVEAGGELGYKKYSNFNTPNQYGFALGQNNLLHGRRQSTASAYLLSALHRSNLDITLEAHVIKILIDSRTKHTYGVKYYKKGRIFECFAGKEVIVSAGAINSPQLLMLSGIGPKEHLNDVGVTVIKDLPVGENLQDHVAFLGGTFLAQTPVTFTLADVLNIKNFEYFVNTGEGIYKSTICDAIAFLHTNSSKINRPEIELALLQGSPATDFGLAIHKVLRIKRDVFEKFWAPIAKVQTFTIAVILLHPKSRGIIKLRSANPFDYPLIQINALSDEKNEDVKVLVKGIRSLLELAQTKTFRDHHISLHNIPIPGCEGYEFHSDYYWECAVRTLSYPFFHAVGTVKMGPVEHPDSVVNHELRVHGISGLRVADGSIIPFIPGAHTAATINMIGEKVSDMIKRAWK